MSFEALAGQRYWFTVQAEDNDNPPQWGRLATFDITACSSAFRSEHFGYPDWVPCEVIYGDSYGALQS